MSMNDRPELAAWSSPKWAALGQQAGWPGGRLQGDPPGIGSRRPEECQDRVGSRLSAFARTEAGDGQRGSDPRGHLEYGNPPRAQRLERMSGHSSGVDAS
jgi:hypothetical protein